MFFCIFSFFFERFDRNLIASSLFQKNKKIGKSVFALLVCCLLMTFSQKNQENHNFFLAVASYSQIEYFFIFFMISKCSESSGANTKKYLKKSLMNSIKTMKNILFFIICMSLYLYFPPNGNKLYLPDEFYLFKSALPLIMKIYLYLLNLA